MMDELIHTQSEIYKYPVLWMINTQHRYSRSKGNIHNVGLYVGRGSSKVLLQVREDSSELGLETLYVTHEELIECNHSRAHDHVLEDLGSGTWLYARTPKVPEALPKKSD